MKFIFKPLLIIALFAFNSMSFGKDSNSNVECFKHNIQLQLSDSLGFPVPGTEFWITLDIIKNGNKVIIQFPVINFQTGPSANAPGEPSLFVPGGYLYTSDGFLPESIRPTDLVYRSIVAASNNGASLPFSFAQDPSTLPVPPAGYILSITNAGAIVVQCAGTFGNIIPPGPQILMPADITYIVKPKVKLCNNTIIGTGFTNTTQFSDPFAALLGLILGHVNDAFDGRAAWAWADNSMVADKTNNVLNLMVAIGETNSQGEMKVGTPMQLTNLDPGFMVFETAVAINRTNRDNIVVSYGVVELNVTGAPGISYRAVSFDGGKTWPVNGPLNIQPTGDFGFGQNRGVSADKYGNFWYTFLNEVDAFDNIIDTPSFVVSSDGGVNYSLIFTAPLPSTLNGLFYQYSQYCFGGDGLGNYGLHFVSYFANNNFDFVPAVGFIPITGLGSFGTPSFLLLNAFSNASFFNDITAASDGRVWMQGSPEAGFATSYIQPGSILFKSPGALDVNYAGPWDYTIFNNKSENYGTNNQISQPVFGYIGNSTQSIIYDDNRSALYAMISQQIPDNSQNMMIAFIISRDNGQTWSDPIEISTTQFANRGFQSMALDTVTGNLVFGWYDGRNDPTFQSVQYFGAIMPAAQLDQLVNRIPLSNPLYMVPSAA